MKFSSWKIFIAYKNFTQDQSLTTCWEYLVCLIFIVFGDYEKLLTMKVSQITLFKLTYCCTIGINRPCWPVPVSKAFFVLPSGRIPILCPGCWHDSSTTYLPSKQNIALLICIVILKNHFSKNNTSYICTCVCPFYLVLQPLDHSMDHLDPKIGGKYQKHSCWLNGVVLHLDVHAIMRRELESSIDAFHEKCELPPWLAKSSSSNSE